MPSRLSRQDAEVLKSRGKIIKNPYFTGFFKIIDGKKSVFSVAVSKKEAKLATDRNRIKRRIREAGRDFFKNSNHSFLLFGKRAALKIPFQSLKKEISDIIEKVDSVQFTDNKR